MPAIPFDSDRLDELLEQAGLDAVLVTSQHNVQYFLGGHRFFFFFGPADAFGLSRYLPVIVYVRGRPEDTHFVGFVTEHQDFADQAPWMDSVEYVSFGTKDAAHHAARRLRSMGITGELGIESPYLPADAYDTLRSELPGITFADATAVLDRLRARKSPTELLLVREAAERVISSMLATASVHGVGSTKREITETLGIEHACRGLTLEYCQLALGTSSNRAPANGLQLSLGMSANRAPTNQVWQPGDVLSIDSGGSYQGYAGDVARVFCVEEPDEELDELLRQVDLIQEAARGPVRAGACGEAIFTAVDEALRSIPSREFVIFHAHGMGLVAHETPHLKPHEPSVPSDAHLPLEAGMVLSIETTIAHPRRGYIKLEDTVAVTATGHDIYAPDHRGWNIARASELTAVGGP